MVLKTLLLKACIEGNPTDNGVELAQSSSFAILIFDLCGGAIYPDETTPFAAILPVASS